MEKHSEQAGRTRCAILGVLAFDDSTGYEIRKLLSETTAHFWKESYGQIYPALEVLHNEGKISVTERSDSGRGSIRYRILPSGLDELKRWIRSPRYVMRPGRNELLLKLFFARKKDAPFLIPQVEAYRDEMIGTGQTYSAIAHDAPGQGLPPDAAKLISATIDYGLAAADMQVEWCRRTLAMLSTL
jgi:PadR family transcriptional regulator AphA